MDNKWGGDTAFMDPMFIKPEWRIGNIGPGYAVALIGFLATGHYARNITVPNVAAIPGFGRTNRLLLHGPLAKPLM
jgi:hypothetical protein